jgi:hypothetical protein
MLNPPPVDRVEGYNGRNTRLSRRERSVGCDHRGDEREMTTGRTAA